MNKVYKKIKKKLQKHTAPVIQIFRHPFDNNGKKLIIHCSHHKAGTRWFSAILRSIAKYYGLSFTNSIDSFLHNNTDIFMENHSRVDFSLLTSNYRASHIIRDPRDIVISSYHYHLWTKESWAHIPMKSLSENMKIKWSDLPLNEFGHLTYQQYLNTLTEEEGLLAEMKRTSAISEMHNWNYENKNCIELKYESLIKNEEKHFRNVFEHYGFNKDAINTALKFVTQHSFKNRSGRKLGVTGKESHFRSGLAEQWKDTYSDRLKTHFKKRYGDTLIKLGYEKDLNW